jgi:hypothetical protein
MSKVSLAGNASGTGIFTIASPNSNTDRTLTLPDNTGTLVTNTSGSVSQSMLATGVAGTGPAFSVVRSTSQSISAGTFVKVQFDSELFDTANSFDSTTNYRFTPQVAGYYQINANINYASSSGQLLTSVYKNNARYIVFDNMFFTSMYQNNNFSSLFVFTNLHQ